MSDFRPIRGFEDLWRPPVRLRTVYPEAPFAGANAATRMRLQRIARRAPEVMVKITGRTRDSAHLKAHLSYISRNGGLELESSDGWAQKGRSEVRELADAWDLAASLDSRRRANTPVSHAVILSMPAGTNEIALRDAARAFAVSLFGGRHEYVLALHTDTPRPHVHLTIASRGFTGARLNPDKADLEHWRQIFAQALRDRGVEAEATPRRARGVTRKPERGPIRRMRERAEAGRGEMPKVRQAAYREAARAAFQGDAAPRVWETKMADRQARSRALYLAQAALLRRSSDDRDRALAGKVEAFVRTMPRPDSQRLALARELREANLERSAAPTVDRRAPGGDTTQGRER